MPDTEIPNWLREDSGPERRPFAGPGGERPTLSVVVPCFNEEQVLPELLKRVIKQLDGFRGTSELVLVNDGSNDATWRMMTQAASADARVLCVNLSRNHGHQTALTAGLTLARGERVFILDADLQDPPELLAAMMDRMDEGFDVVYGKRRRRAGDTAFKVVTARWFYRLIESMSDTAIPRDAGDFRLMSRRSVDVLLSMPERHRFIRGMVSWIGFPQAAFEYDRDPRFAGETKYPLRKMIAFAKDAMTGFSVKPLTFATKLGTVSVAVACGVVGYAIWSWLFLDTTPGWTSVVSVVAFFGGVQLIVLGVMGEYLGRLYEESKGRPLFVIQDVVRGAGDTQEAPMPEIVVRQSSAEDAAAGR
ncbi:MAG: glycosyltransferase family 2 protein [Planctomycetota bacterium]